MNIDLLMQFVTYALMGIGVLAFVVSMVTQVIKEMPYIKQVQTNAVALAVAMILCPLSVIILCQYFDLIITWYYVFASFIAAFIVYLVSTGGWERVKEMWDRTNYKNRDLFGE